MFKNCSSLLVVSLAPLAAQTTWIVNAGGGPGVNFTDLPAAVAAASDGDTIIVETGPFGEGAVGFTTSKGLTIVGRYGYVPIVTSPSNPVRVTNLPATSAFRMVGFLRGTVGQLNFEIDNCAGMVHLERMLCREPDLVFPSGPALSIHNSANVTLRAFSSFGSPAVDIVGSTVSMAHCQLGVTYLGLGGGQAIRANNATVDVIEPAFDTGWGTAASIELHNTALRLAGGPWAAVRNPGGPIVMSTGGSVWFDPSLPLAPASGQPVVAGTAGVTQQVLPATWTGHAQQQLSFRTSAPDGAYVFYALGSPGFLVPSPLGTLGIDTQQPWAFLNPSIAFQGYAPGNWPGYTNYPWLQGTAWTVQAAVLTPTVFTLSLPCTFVVH